MAPYDTALISTTCTYIDLIKPSRKEGGLLGRRLSEEEGRTSIQQWRFIFCRFSIGNIGEKAKWRPCLVDVVLVILE